MCRQVLALLLCSVVGAGSCSPSASPTLSTPFATGDRSVRIVGGGIELLPSPFVGVADDASELASMFVSVPKPPDVDELGVDWANEVVVVVALGSNACPPVLADLQIAGEAAKTVFVSSRGGEPICNDEELSFTSLAAVARSLLAPVSRLEVSRATSERPELSVGINVRVLAEASTSTSVQPDAEFGPVRGEATLPDVGEASIAELDDGSPIFIVHHHDGSVSALDPRGRENLDGLTGVVVWSADVRIFNASGSWDEFGRRLDGFRSSDLRAFHTRVVGERVEIGAEVATPAGAPIPDTEDPPASNSAAVDLRAALSLAEALAEPIGTSMVVDASVVVDPKGSLVCGQRPKRIFPIEPCEPGSPTAVGMPGMPGFRQEHFGPLLATRTADGFEFIAATGGTAGEAI